MKKIMFALCFMFGGIVTLTAQETQDTTSNQYRTETQSQYPQDMVGQNQDRERIQATELPDEVKRSLEGEEYRGWLVSGAFKSQGGAGSDTTGTESNRQGAVNATTPEGEEIFIVELKNGAETKTVNFTADGQKVEGMEELNNQDSQFNQNDQMNQPAPVDPSLPPTPTDRTRPEDPNAQQSADPNATQPELNQTTPVDPTQQTPANPAPGNGTTQEPRTNGPK